MLKNPRWMMFADRGLIRLDQPTGTPTPTPTPIPTPPAPTGGTFTQEDLNRIAAAEADKGERRGKQAAAEEAAKTLGVSVEEAARIIKAHQEAEAAAMSEAQRLEAAAKATQAAAEADRAAAKLELHAARVERALTTAGVDEKAIAAVNVPGITVDSTPEEIKAAVDKLKVDVPSLFTGVVVPPNADPQRPGQPLGAPATGTLGGEGIKRFEQRFPDKPKA